MQVIHMMALEIAAGVVTQQGGGREDRCPVRIKDDPSS